MSTWHTQLMVLCMDVWNADKRSDSSTIIDAEFDANETMKHAAAAAAQ